jgi:hypothetical protein
MGYVQYPITGRYSAATPSANNTEVLERLSFFYVDTSGDRQAVVLGSTDYIELCTLQLNCLASAVFNIYGGSDNVIDACEQLFLIKATSGTSPNFRFRMPRRSQLGTYPKLKQVGGVDTQTDAVVEGFWYKNG